MQTAPIRRALGPRRVLGETGALILAALALLHACAGSIVLVCAAVALWQIADGRASRVRRPRGERDRAASGRRRPLDAAQVRLDGLAGLSSRRWSHLVEVDCAGFFGCAGPIGFGAPDRARPASHVTHWDDPSEPEGDRRRARPVGRPLWNEAVAT